MANSEDTSCATQKQEIPLILFIVLYSSLIFAILFMIIYHNYYEKRVRNQSQLEDKGQYKFIDNFIKRLKEKDKYRQSSVHSKHNITKIDGLDNFDEQSRLTTSYRPQRNSENNDELTQELMRDENGNISTIMKSRTNKAGGEKSSHVSGNVV